MLVTFIIEGAIKGERDDIFYKPLCSKEWQRLYSENYLEVVHTSSKSFEKKYAELANDMLALSAAASKGLGTGQISLGGVIKTGFNTIYYKMFASERKKQAELFLSNPEPHIAANVFNLLDSKYTKGILKLMMPKIEVSKCIYVPKLLPRLTIKNVLSDRDMSSYLKSKGDLKGSGEDTADSKLSEEDEFVNIEKPEPYLEKKIKPLPENYVKVRILSPYKLPSDWKPEQKINTKGMKFDRIIVDIHGGGFIATSTRLHQTYLRKWAKKCNAVVFAIDYKLAPEEKYPALLDEVRQAYFWIITQAEKEFKVKLKTVLLAGDSAGGNLAMALTLFAIRSKFRVPDGIIAAYPALNLSINAFTPSLLTSMDDFMLRYSFLNVCINSYIPPGADSAKDPYISPSLVSDEDLMKFPPIRIMTAGRDPLRDESYKLICRLVKLKKDAKMVEYRNFPHGFWNLDIMFGLKEAKLATTKAIEWFEEFFVANETDIDTE
jgi:hormone-sensitive lipase